MLFYKMKKTLPQLSIFGAALLLLREYILCFQQAEPAIHKLFNNQVKVLIKFHKTTSLSRFNS